MSTPTLFLRLTNAINKEEALTQILTGKDSANCYSVDLSKFSVIPGTPFPYWAPEELLKTFSSFPKFESNERSVRQGGVTGNDEKYLRLWWEIDSEGLQEKDIQWVPFAKGGNYSPYYSDISTVVKWHHSRSTYYSFTGLPHRPSEKPSSASFYFKSGLTWPLRASRFAPVPLPKNAVFSIRGYGILPNDESELMTLLAICNSWVFDYIFKFTLGRFGFPEFVVGVLQNLPMPSIKSIQLKHKDELAEHAFELWSIKQKIAECNEIDHTFLKPSILSIEGVWPSERISTLLEIAQSRYDRIYNIQNNIDNICNVLYGIDLELANVLHDCNNNNENEDYLNEVGTSDDEAEAVNVLSQDLFVFDLLSWLFGAAMGRWDADLATGDRPVPPLPGPFDKLPSVSRGMLLGADGLHPAKDAAGRFMPEHDLLVDDEGENLDLVRRVHEVLERVAGERADAWLLELEGLLGTDLRTWYRRSFFERHLKRYSKSNRKAPIYWQLGTPSGSYSVWLYYPRLTRDSLFRLLNDVVKPKVTYEEQRLAGMREQNARRSELEPQEALVEELQAFRDEVARVTPLFDPNLDDGVLINAAPIHRLFVHAGWRRDTQAAWTQLVRGDFEWSHMALHLWPERVIPLCTEQRHLALAHDLEGPLKTRSVEALVATHTRPAVKDALQALLNASPQAGGRSAGRPARAPRAPRPAPEPRAAAEPMPRAPRASAEVPEATLAAIREVLARFPGGAAKFDVLSATGIPDGTWNTAIAKLLATGDVERQGEKRGTRYFLVRR